METRVRRTLSVLALVGATSAGFAAGRFARNGSRVVNLEVIDWQFAQGFASGWPKVDGKPLVRVSSINGYTIWSPPDSSKNDLVVFGPGDRSAVRLDNTHAIITSGLQSEHELRYVNIWDKRGNGSFSFISYVTLDDSGNPNGMVTDADRDGQPDWRRRNETLVAGSSPDDPTEIFVSGGWYIKEKRGDTVGVIADGRWREVQKKGEKYSFS